MVMPRLLTRRASRSLPGYLAALSLLGAAIAPAILPSAARAQDFGTLTLLAGHRFGKQGNGIAATDASIYPVYGIAADPQGNVYEATFSYNVVRRVDAASGLIDAYAGTGVACAPPASCGQGGPAVSALLQQPRWLTADSAGNVYIAEFSTLNRVRMVRASDGNLIHVAGEGSLAVGSSDCVLAMQSTLNISGGIALAPQGNLYIANGPEVLRVDPDGHITSVAGGGNPLNGANGDGGPAKVARFFSNLTGIAADAHGNLYVTDGPRVRKIDAGADGVVTGATDETISTIAGTGKAGQPVDFMKATASPLFDPADLVVDANGDLYVLDPRALRVRRVIAGSDGVINGADDEIMTTVVGGGNMAVVNGVQATDARFGALGGGIALDTKGNMYVSDGGDFVYKIAGITAGPVAPGIGPDLTLGDLNGDGKINIQDATLSLRLGVGALTPIPAQMHAGDVTRDGKLNIQDATVILQLAVGNRAPCF